MMKPMIPGEVFVQPGEIVLNDGRPTITLRVANTGDRPIQVGSHYHFYETNEALYLRSRRDARLPAGHSRRLRRALRTGAEPQRHAGRDRRRARDLRLLRRRERPVGELTWPIAWSAGPMP